MSLYDILGVFAGCLLSAMGGAYLDGVLNNRMCAKCLRRRETAETQPGMYLASVTLAGVHEIGPERRRCVGSVLNFWSDGPKAAARFAADYFKALTQADLRHGDHFEVSFVG